MKFYHMVFLWNKTELFTEIFFVFFRHFSQQRKSCHRKNKPKSTDSENSDCQQIKEIHPCINCNPHCTQQAVTCINPNGSKHHANQKIKNQTLHLQIPCFSNFMQNFPLLFHQHEYLENILDILNHKKS